VHRFFEDSYNFQRPFTTVQSKLSEKALERNTRFVRGEGGTLPTVGKAGPQRRIILRPSRIWQGKVAVAGRGEPGGYLLKAERLLAQQWRNGENFIEQKYQPTQLPELR
jgi:hypothetical protein